MEIKKLEQSFSVCQAVEAHAYKALSLRCCISHHRACGSRYCRAARQALKIGKYKISPSVGHRPMDGDLWRPY